MNVYRFQKGQRWEFKPHLPEFENTLVIGRINEANPEWGWHETRYDVYVRYSSLATPWIPSDYDGMVLSLTLQGLNRSVIRLVENGVELPWWWVYGRRFASQSDV